MGLDMYLYRTKKIEGINSPEEYGKLSFTAKYDDVGYWRKANAIHQWFVKNAQVDEKNSFSFAFITKQQLENLMNVVTKVLNDHTLAESLLPTQAGFFFGSTEYDEWYFTNVEKTRDTLERALLETDWEKQVVLYHASW